MKEQLENLFKQTYQSGYEHGIEDTKNLLKKVFDSYIQSNPNFDEEYKKIFEGMIEVLGFPQETL
jgi:acyl CoA:acetate/3-ketoacid CoA transferase alpha subunit